MNKKNKSMIDKKDNKKELRENMQLISSIILGIMGVILSFAGIFISVQTNKIAKMQAEYSKQEAMPLFKINEYYVYNDKTQKYDNTEIKVTNINGIYYNYESEVISFLKIGYSISGDSREVLRPLLNYYFAHGKEDESTGEIENIKCNDNNKLYSKIFRELFEYKKDDFTCSSCDRITIMKIKYLDYLKKQHTDYYEVSPTYSILLDNSEGNTLFEKYNKYYDNLDYFDLDKIDINLMVDYLKKVKE